MSVSPPVPDKVPGDIADYLTGVQIDSGPALSAARYCLMDALACALQALDHADCTGLLGPVVPGATTPGGSRVPGTSYELDPVQGAFNIGAMVSWLDLNAACLATEWGHLSDSLGGILAVADFLGRKRLLEGSRPISVREVLAATVKAHDIQGVMARKNSIDQADQDRELRVRVATAAVVAGMLGGGRAQIIKAVSNAWNDGGAPGACRPGPGEDAGKGRAVGVANSRGVHHAMSAVAGETGCPPDPGVTGEGGEGGASERPEVGIAMDHGKCSEEDILLLVKKFEASIGDRLSPGQSGALAELCSDQARLERTPVSAFMALLVSAG